MTWKVKEFESLVRECYGEDQLKKLKVPLESVFWKLMLARYHAEESKRLLRSYLSEETADELVQVINQVLLAASGSEEDGKFVEAQVVSEAHVIAFAQSLHSTADILAQVVYFGLNLDGNLAKPIKERNRTIHCVCNNMRKAAFALGVVDAIEDFRQLPEFRYLQAYVNITKHRSLVDVTHSISLDPANPRYGVKILPFEYKTENFSERWADDFVEQDYIAIREGINRIGAEMNKFLKKVSGVS
jgi:NTP pyrophosphatase (non-canonical NTP hydrolase)